MAHGSNTIARNPRQGVKQMVQRQMKSSVTNNATPAKAPKAAAKAPKAAKAVPAKPRAAVVRKQQAAVAQKQEASAAQVNSVVAQRQWATLVYEYL